LCSGKSYTRSSCIPRDHHIMYLFYFVCLFTLRSSTIMQAFMQSSHIPLVAWTVICSPQQNRAGLGCGSDHGARGRFEKKQTRGIYTPTALWRSPSKGVSNIGSSSPLNEHWPPPSISPSALWSRSRSRSSPSPRAPSRTLDTVRDEYWVRI
jgi:hypothetical protein